MFAMVLFLFGCAGRLNIFGTVHSSKLVQTCSLVLLGTKDRLMI